MHDHRLRLSLAIPKKRTMYDQYGEEGLKGGVSPPAALLSSLEAMLLPLIENKLPCTLELYKGTTKKMKISREIADISG
ncbi:uncharacterized protein LOC110095105 [Dendrobium catenatum]|uniref:uncharacterized protein LOC110095105 n=1 Tax=Dendrobium catenatum TaxID=906689 RepID=UPI0009F6D8E6|nr:uncharacterized protein LOC110095105 [Dendrobium catenatum]